VYNGERFLREAVESILNQTFEDFEFIIINDGSTDRTGEILNSYKDERLKIFNQPNRGLTKSLNRALKLSQGKYIARQDADDISEPNRLEVQVTYLEFHPEVA
jgi:glycosyltransferase involved in cell wall biosynthesis